MNLFDSGIKLPKRVFIVAPGFEGWDHYGKIDWNDTVIAVNRGVLAAANPTYWLCSDAHLVEQKWFCDFPITSEVAIFSKMLARWCEDNLLDIHPHYTFSPDPVLNVRDCGPMEGVLRCGATVSAQALQMAYWFGARHITFVGCDFKGRKYFDGTEANYADNRDLEWPGIGRFDLLIEWMKMMRIKVDSLSPTALDLEVVDDA